MIFSIKHRRIWTILFKVAFEIQIIKNLNDKRIIPYN